MKPLINLAWSTPQQRVSSSSTSISYPDPEKKSPVIFTNFKNGLLTIGPINADIGGGKYDQITDWLKSKGITNVVWDRFNRSAEYNSASQAKLQGGKADTATVSNVLNVIPDPASRKAVIATAFDSIKDGGVAYFSTYVAPKAEMFQVVILSSLGFQLAGTSLKSKRYLVLDLFRKLEKCWWHQKHLFATL